jgi:NAD(P)-dependent dehydrogenase (short-subunit alcohol dehydrogenase family)
MGRQLDFKDRVVLITGGGQGIGRELVRETLERGGIPVVVEVDPGLEEAVRSQITDRGSVHIADVRDGAAMERIVADTVAAYGRLDVVLANAGIERLGPVWEMPPDDFGAVVEINVLGAYRTMKPALPHVMKAGGHLLTIASLAALIPVPFATAYCTSKAAVDMMMRSIRLELLGTGVTAGAAYFGVIPTRMGTAVAGHEMIAAVMNRLPGWAIGNTPTPTAELAARRIMDGVERRKARVYAPSTIRLTYLLRGLLGQGGDLQGRYILGIPDLVRERYGSKPGAAD